jgi:isoleucyl-tRNA synthetase
VPNWTAVISELNQWCSMLLVRWTDKLPQLSGASQTFIDLLSNWYVRRSRRRFWKSESDDDKLAAHETLYRMPYDHDSTACSCHQFVTEEMYQNLVRSVDPTTRRERALDGLP